MRKKEIKMTRTEDIREDPMLEAIRNNLKMRGIFISERNVYSYEDQIKKLEEEKVEPQKFLDYLVENDNFNIELKDIKLAEEALTKATDIGTLSEEEMEAIQVVLDEVINTHKTTIRMTSWSEAGIRIADKEIAQLKEDKMLALNISDEDIMDFLSKYR